MLCRVCLPHSIVCWSVWTAGAVGYLVLLGSWIIIPSYFFSKMRNAAPFLDRVSIIHALCTIAYFLNQSMRKSVCYIIQLSCSCSLSLSVSISPVALFCLFVRFCLCVPYFWTNTPSICSHRCEMQAKTHTHTPIYYMWECIVSNLVLPCR